MVKPDEECIDYVSRQQVWRLLLHADGKLLGGCKGILLVSLALNGGQG
jgi:hypothetical protein